MKLKISAQIQIVTIGLLMAAVLVLSLVFDRAAEHQRLQQERESAQNLFRALDSLLLGQQQLVLSLAGMVAEDSQTQQAFAAGDRAALAARWEPVFKRLQQEQGMEQFQFHTAPATSFLRVHQPAKFGDDLSSFRQTVVDANRKQQSVFGLESGVAGLGIRGVVPVRHQGSMIGTVEFGLGLTPDLLKRFEAEHARGVVVYVPTERELLTAASPSGNPETLDAARVRAVQQGKNFEQVGKTYQAAHLIRDFSGEPVAVAALDLPRDDFFAAQSQLRSVLVILAGLVLVVAGGLAMWLSRGLSRPIVDAANRLHDIAHGEGDLTRRLQVRGASELQDLASSFNLFVEHIAGIIGTIRGAQEHLRQMATDLAQSMRQELVRLESQESEVEQVAAAMNEMSATSQEIARNVTVGLHSAEQGMGSVQRGTAVVITVVNDIRTQADLMEAAVNDMQALDRASEQIDQVLRVIDEIAGQTNLLALNAAIEAARAGEAGRGFAVVADEVRSLAQRTANSTKQIQGLITELHGRSSDGVRAIQDRRDQARELALQAGGTHQSLEEIRAAMSEITGITAQIAAAAEEQSQAAEAINQNLAGISRDVQGTNSSAEALFSLSEEMKRQCDKVEALLSRFRISI